MGLFGKNAGAGQDGARHWTNVIKNSGPGGLLLWRQPEEDFNTDSTLVVMPGESAVFVSQGTIEQVFESGTYQLSTQNYPFITRLRSILTGGVLSLRRLFCAEGGQPGNPLGYGHAYPGTGQGVGHLHLRQGQGRLPGAH